MLKTGPTVWLSDHWFSCQIARPATFFFHIIFKQNILLAHILEHPRSPSDIGKRISRLPWVIFFQGQNCLIPNFKHSSTLARLAIKSHLNVQVFVWVVFLFFLRRLIFCFLDENADWNKFVFAVRLLVKFDSGFYECKIACYKFQFHLEKVLDEFKYKFSWWASYVPNQRNWVQLGK